MSQIVRPTFICSPLFVDLPRTSCFPSSIDFPMTLSMKIQLCQWNENFSSAPKIYLALAPRVPLLLSTFFTQKHRKIIKFTDIRDNLYFFFFKFKKKILPSTSVGIWLGVLKFYAATYILKRKKMFILKIQRFDRLDFV